MLTRRRLLQAAATVPLAAGLPARSAQAPVLTAAPMAGHFTHERVRLWLQASAATDATISCWPEQGSESGAKNLDVSLADRNAFSAIAEFRGLAANTRYRFTVQLGGKATGLAQSFRTAPAPGSPPTAFRIYLGSCAYTEAMAPNGTPYGDEFHIFDSIAAKMQTDGLPHFMLWLGDNLYFRPKGQFLANADYSSVERMEARYREVREKQMFQKLFAATHHYAIWDDHDYGPNDADKTFRFKADALRLFRQYWPNPDMGSADLPGTWTKFVHQDAEFFLLDDRTYRDNEKAEASASKAMFGPEQMQWLKQSLKSSKATFKLVANGSQMLSEHDNGSHSGWHSYQAERDAFFDWLARERIPGLVFLSGDRHNTQVFRQNLAGAEPVYEFSCSPFTSRLYGLDKRERVNPRLVKELVVEQRNYGTLEFAGAGASRTIIARCFDANAKLLWEKVLAHAGSAGAGGPG